MIIVREERQFVNWKNRLLHIAFIIRDLLLYSSYTPCTNFTNTHEAGTERVGLYDSG